MSQISKHKHPNADSRAGNGPRRRFPSLAGLRELETVGRVPRACQEFLRDKGVSFVNSNRSVNYEAVIAGIEEKILKPLFSGDGSKLRILGLAGNDYIDPDYEDSRSKRSAANMAEIEEAQKRGEIADVTACEVRCWTEMLSPAREGLRNMLKKFNRFPNQREKIALEICMQDIPALITSIKNNQPFRVKETDMTDYEI